MGNYKTASYADDNLPYVAGESHREVIKSLELQPQTKYLRKTLVSM